METRGIFESSAAVACRHGESSSLICGRLVLFRDGKRRYAAGSATFTESLDGFSQPVLRRESSGPSGSSFARVAGRVARTGRERFAHWRLAFKQTDLDPPTGGCSNQRVRVGQSPACTAPLARHVITRHLIFNST